MLKILRSLFNGKKEKLEINLYRPTQNFPKYIAGIDVAKSDDSNVIGSEMQVFELTINGRINAVKCPSFNVKKGTYIVDENQYFEMFDTEKNESLGEFSSVFKMSKRLSVYPKTISKHLYAKYSGKHDEKDLDNILFRHIRITKKTR